MLGGCIYTFHNLYICYTKRDTKRNAAQQTAKLIGFSWPKISGSIHDVIISLYMNMYLNEYVHIYDIHHIYTIIHKIV